MKNRKTLKLIYAALFAALIFIATQFLKVPLPFGYFNFGDCFIILSAFIIGGPYAIFASAIGSVLADIISGYAIYAPATLLIKSGMALSVILIHKKNSKRYTTLICACTSELIMICGYFLYDSMLYSFAAALSTLPGSIFQAVAAVMTSTALVALLQSSGLMKFIKESL
ncbi:MAG: ECF transporter S component [Faecalimonas sp.]|nr:ECF transporter S component [Faecalimonas sp.]